MGSDLRFCGCALGQIRTADTRFRSETGGDPWSGFHCAATPVKLALAGCFWLFRTLGVPLRYLNRVPPRCRRVIVAHARNAFRTRRGGPPRRHPLANADMGRSRLACCGRGDLPRCALAGLEFATTWRRTRSTLHVVSHTRVLARCDLGDLAATGSSGHLTAPPPAATRIRARCGNGMARLVGLQAGPSRECTANSFLPDRRVRQLAPRQLAMAIAVVSGGRHQHGWGAVAGTPQSQRVRRGLTTPSHRPDSGAGEPAGVAGSRVAVGHHGVTRSALDAARRRADSGAQGRRHCTDEYAMAG